MKATICVGVSASGKTTWAMQTAVESIKHTIVVSRDDIRRKILELKHGRPLLPGELWKMWKFKDEDKVTEIVKLEIETAANVGADLIIADTNLVKKYRDMMVSRLESLKYDVSLKFFDISFEEAVKRDAGRQDGVGHSVIWKQILQYNETVGRRTYTPNKSMPTAVICDIDGTLAHMKGRSAFDWGKVGEDTVDEIVKGMLRGFRNSGHEIIILSGRDGCCYDETEKWLIKHHIIYDRFYMRAAGDMRKDAIIKEEIFWDVIAENYNVVAVIDDRPQVCRLWYQLGLKVINVGDPYLEF